MQEKNLSTFAFLPFTWQDHLRQLPTRLHHEAAGSRQARDGGVTEWPNVPVLKTLRTAYRCYVLLCKSMQLIKTAGQVRESDMLKSALEV